MSSFSLLLLEPLMSVELRAPLGVELRSDGVTLKRVREGSWAAEAGLKGGDKLLSLGGAKLRKRDLVPLWAAQLWLASPPSREEVPGSPPCSTECTSAGR